MSRSMARHLKEFLSSISFFAASILTVIGSILTGRAGAVKPVIACVGDSITKGLGASNFNVSSYPSLLQEHPGFRHFSVRNFGVGGTTAIKSTNQSFWSTDAFQESLKCGPDIVVLQLGTNDAKLRYWDIALYQNDYKALAQLYKSLPSKPIVLMCIPPPLYSNASLYFGIQSHVLNYIIPKLVPNISEEVGAILVDHFSLLGGSGLTRPQFFLDSSQPLEWSRNDGIHPNDFGYKTIANNIATIIRERYSGHQVVQRSKGTRTSREI